MTTDRHESRDYVPPVLLGPEGLSPGDWESAPPRGNVAAIAVLLFGALLVFSAGNAVGYFLAGQIIPGIVQALAVWVCLGVGFWTAWNVRG
jgi:hypothetical protein